MPLYKYKIKIFKKQIEREEKRGTYLNEEERKGSQRKERENVGKFAIILERGLCRCLPAVASYKAGILGFIFFLFIYFFPHLKRLLLSLTHTIDSFFVGYFLF